MATEVERTTTPADQGEFELQGASAPLRPRRPRISWVDAMQSRERRWWTVALAATLLISATAIGLLYLDDSNNQAAVRALQTSNESLTGRNEILTDQLKATSTNLTATLSELAKAKAAAEHPQVVIWNTPVTIKDNTYYLAGGIPDTFTFHLQATSTGPMNVSILTIEQFVAASRCVAAGGGPTNYCMHHSGVSWSALNVTSVNYDFHLAEGCADYLEVFTAPNRVTVTPAISVTYNPATAPTGACA